MSQTRIAATTLGLSAAVATLGLVTASHAAATVGVYDELLPQANQVDTSATLDTNTNQVSVATFTANVATAFAADLGGVINFEDPSGITNDPNGTNDQIVATYGVTQTNSITIGPSGTNGNLGFGGLFTPGNGRTPISGTTAVGFTLTTSPAVNPKVVGFSFDAADRVSSVGLTVLSRDSTTASVIGVATFSDATTASATSSVGPGGAVDDTFFGFTLTPTQLTNGVSITAFRVQTDAGSFLAADDLGFITIPEPTSLALLGLGGLMLLPRRQRA